MMEPGELIRLLRLFQDAYDSTRGTLWIGTVRPEQAFERAADALEAALLRISELEGLISEQSIERLAEDIAIACVDCLPPIREARHRAMVRLGERLRKPLKRDLAVLSPLGG